MVLIRPIDRWMIAVTELIRYLLRVRVGVRARVTAKSDQPPSRCEATQRSRGSTGCTWSGLGLGLGLGLGMRLGVG